MLYQIVSFVLHVAVGLVGGLCLLRAYLHHQRISMSARAGNPLGPFIFALTDWVVLPLRKLLPPAGRIEWASLLAAYLLQLALLGGLWVMAGSHGSPVALLWMALVGLVRWVLSAMTGLLIIYAVLSWVRSDAPIGALIDRLVAPWLRPVRRALPLVGGVDLSPLVLLVLLQVAGMVLDALYRAPI